MDHLFNLPVSPPGASNFAQEYDFVFYLLLALTVLFTAMVSFAVIFFAVRYRRGTKVDRSRPIYEDLRLELSWTFIPLILALGMFFLGARLFMRMKLPPKNAQEVFVIGKQWMWHIQHSNGVRENNTLHVPLNQPIKVTMISQDVIHALYIPAFRVQMHVVPGRYTQLWFTPTQVGEYHMFCAMYCGTQHSEMGGKVVVMKPSDWSEWVANGGNSVPHMTMEQSGYRVFNRVGCNNCHGHDDNLRAPSLAGIYEKKRFFTDGTSEIADEAYLRESILSPWNHITQGYGRTMPAYQGQLSEEEVLNLIAYIKGSGVGQSAPASSLISREAAPTQSSKQPVNDVLAVGAIRANTESHDATPTVRNDNPSVGAIAAGSGGQ